ncbi:hypothetical protein FB45DRAFT_215684 [Roridomyces roridus]|uniref:Uncharacterized protein n=1 Tax=Roridomyces roridus TaxID=1738132 RepID=A0AAD7BDW8_9AGAR|nr:hypothetical protein FB45DRAFT_215684 [Roridomyces roridus]
MRCDRDTLPRSRAKILIFPLFFIRGRMRRRSGASMSREFGGLGTPMWHKFSQWRTSPTRTRWWPMMLELLPYEAFLALTRASPIMTVYLYACWNADNEAVHRDQPSIFDSPDISRWIRRSTGRLCIDLVPTEFAEPFLDLLLDDDLTTSTDVDIDLAGHTRWLHDCNLERRVMQHLTIFDFHLASYWMLCRSSWRHTMFTMAEFALGDVLYYSGLGEPVKIACSYTVISSIWSRMWWSYKHKANAAIQETGWARLKASDMMNRRFTLHITQRDQSSTLDRSWLSQGNHILRHNSPGRNYQDFKLVDSIFFNLDISMSPERQPEAYLFLCPPEWFRVHPTVYGWPRKPFYRWSLDPTGDSFLSPEDAANLGFPSIQASIEVRGRSWDASTYGALRLFHEVKGFDPTVRKSRCISGIPCIECLANSRQAWKARYPNTMRAIFWVSSTNPPLEAIAFPTSKTKDPEISVHKRE